MRQKRKHIPAKVKTQIMERDGYRCRYCAGQVGGLGLDHVIPVSQGGSDDPMNLVTACWSCNQSKRNRTPRQAGMKLRSATFEPLYRQCHFCLWFTDSWKPLGGDEVWCDHCQRIYKLEQSGVPQDGFSEADDPYAQDFYAAGLEY